MDAFITTVLSLISVGIVAVVGLLLKLNGKQEAMQAILEHPDTGMGARFTLMASRVHQIANDAAGNKMLIETLDERVERMDQRLLRVEDRRP